MLNNFQATQRLLTPELGLPIYERQSLYFLDF